MSTCSRRIVRAFAPVFIAVLHATFLHNAAFAHELCRNPNIVIAPRSLGFCSAYNNRPSCCDSGSDATVQTDFNSVVAQGPGSACSDLIKQVMCTRCDAWEDHLYERSAQTGSAPSLCPDFCRTLYDTCRNSVLVNSPFAPTQTTTLVDAFPTQASFCTVFAPSDASYCFDGQPYEPDPPVVPTSGYRVCVEHLSDYDNDMIGVVPVPGRFDALLAYTRGGLMRALSTSNGRINTALGNNGVVGTVTLFCPTPSGGSEQGLLSVAFKPDFATSGLFYVYGNVASSANSGIDTAIREWQCATPATLANCVSGNLVLQVFQPFANHNGGHMQFAPHDPRILVLALGDGGSGCDPGNEAVDDNQILGKVVRIRLPQTGSAGNFNYDIPSDNPFASNSGSREMCGKNPSGQRARTTLVCQETWALGLRNPFRCSIDRFDPARVYPMYCGDVGQGFAEEVDVIPTHATSNPTLAARLPLHYGWDIFEGDSSARVSGGNCGATTSTCPAGADSRVVEATTSRTMECPLRVERHSQGWRSVIGGYVCRSCRETALQDRYIYADYLLKGLVVVNPQSPGTSFTLQTQLCNHPSCGTPEQGGARSLQQGGTFVWSFGEDNHGSLYLINPEQGLYRIVPQPLCANSTDPLYNSAAGHVSWQWSIVSLTVATLCLFIMTVL